LRDCNAVAIQNRRVNKNLWLLTLELEGEFEVPEPGQFVQLRTGVGTDPLLRRPFSVASYEAGRTRTLQVLYAPVGRWTRLVASYKAGFELDVLGPLGNQFATEDEDLSILVAGGRGVAPLLYLSRRLSSTERDYLSLVGARSERDLYWNEEIAGPGEVKLATEDGSVGTTGVVTDLLEKELGAGDRRAAVYACGPLAMLKSVAEICSKTGTRCQVSVETVFACGIGVCRGCLVPSTQEERSHLMACSDGPVLRAEYVDWERFSE
jgi:dihydroorotate dehydrogenase electron transfer subunit